MLQLKIKFSRFYYNIVNSIGFYPSIVAAAYFILAILLMIFDYSSLGEKITGNYSFLKINDIQTARAILTTLIGGIISLTVLSFSMVMIVLTQAANNLSPKLILGIITEKGHQYVLGSYLGSIIYCMVILLMLRKIEAYTIPSISVIFSIFLGIWCLGLFVYFIHHISLSIQVNNLTQEIHDQTHDMLKAEIRKQLLDTQEGRLKEAEEPEFQSEYYSFKSAFLQDINFRQLIKVASKHNLVIKLNGYIGDYYVEDTPIFYLNKPAEEIHKKITHHIYRNFLFYSGERISQNYVYGFTQLMEVAVKALSPGINDPGTAKVCIHYLTDLFILRAKMRDTPYHFDQSGSLRLIVYPIEFTKLLNMCVTPIRQYSSNDIMIARQLLIMFETIALFDKGTFKFQEMLTDQAEGILQNIKTGGYNDNDRKGINAILEDMERRNPGYFTLEKL